jgi:hypothetical protein
VAAGFGEAFGEAFGEGFGEGLAVCVLLLAAERGRAVVVEEFEFCANAKAEQNKSRAVLQKIPLILAPLR